MQQYEINPQPVFVNSASNDTVIYAEAKREQTTGCLWRINQGAGPCAAQARENMDIVVFLSLSKFYIFKYVAVSMNRRWPDLFIFFMCFH